MSNALLASPRVILVTGPARSGKSEWAEHLARQSGQPVTYIATAAIDPTDEEWMARIQQHRQRRPSQWKTLELSTTLPGAIAHCKPTECLLVDSLGTWLVHYLEAEEDLWQSAVTALVNALEATAGTVILVSEETGWGVVPAYPMGRLFRDRLGTVTRHIGTVSQAVYVVTAGYAVDLRQMGHVVPRAAGERVL